MDWKIKRTGIKRANCPKIKMIARPGGQGLLSITVSREGGAHLGKWRAPDAG